MALFTSNTPIVAQIQAYDPAPAAVRAAAYLRVLKEMADPAASLTPCPSPRTGAGSKSRTSVKTDSRIQYFQGLARQLESALESFEKMAAGWRHGVEDFQSYIELDWCCNQCEYWLGPAENADPAQIDLKWADMRCREPAVTAAEMAAVKLLVLASGLSVRARQNPLALLPRPAPICKWIYKTMTKFARNTAAEKLFAIKLFKRRFTTWLKMLLK